MNALEWGQNGHYQNKLYVTYTTLVIHNACG
jgi:hypothetical protein